MEIVTSWMAEGNTERTTVSRASSNHTLTQPTTWYN